MTWWTPTAVVCGDRETGLGLGGACGQPQTGDRDPARHQRPDNEPVHALMGLHAGVSLVFVCRLSRGVVLEVHGGQSATNPNKHCSPLLITDPLSLPCGGARSGACPHECGRAAAPANPNCAQGWSPTRSVRMVTQNPTDPDCATLRWSGLNRRPSAHEEDSVRGAECRLCSQHRRW